MNKRLIISETKIRERTLTVTVATQRALGSCPLPAASFRDIDFENNSHPDMTLTAFAVDWALKTDYLYFENNKFDYKYQNKLHFGYHFTVPVSQKR